MARQLILLFLVIYAVHLYNPQYYAWIQANSKNIKLILIIAIFFFIYRFNDFNEYAKKTFKFFHKLDSDLDKKENERRYAI